MSYWGYPGIVLGGVYYGDYYGPYYPYGSAALTVIRKDHLKAPNVHANALRGESLAGLNKISLTSKSLDLRPSGTKISVQPLDGNKVLLRRDDRSVKLEGGRAAGPKAMRSPAGAAEGSSRVIRKPGEQSGGETRPAGKAGAATVKSPAVKSGGATQKAGAAKASGASKSAERKIRKKGEEPSSVSSPAAGYSSSPAVAGPKAGTLSPRTVHGYPSSPSVTRPKSLGDGGTARSRSFLGPFSSGRSSGAKSRPSSVRSSGSSSKGSQPRTGMSSGRSSSSRGSSSSSRGRSSSGSRGSSGGSVRKK
jgi:hypothetical protein